MNISELAQHLGVAASTVSRVLSGNAEKYRISDRTARRVREAAERYRVAPDPLGAGLRRGRLGMIGLLVPDITNPFFSQLARALELKFRASGVAVQLCDSAEDGETERDLLGKMLSRRLDGMIVAPVGEVTRPLADLLENAPLPIVLLDRVLPGIAIPSVSLDNHAAGALAAERLLREGHRNLGCLRGAPDSASDRERLEGVRAALAKAGLPPSALRVAGEGYTREDSLASARELLDRPARPTGVITLSGQGVLGVVEECRRLGLSIPRELSLVAFDEQPWSALMVPPLTTVTQPVEEMAASAIDLLSRLLENPEAPVPREPQVFPATLNERASVSRPGSS